MPGTVVNGRVYCIEFTVDGDSVREVISVAPNAYLAIEAVSKRYRGHITSLCEINSGPVHTYPSVKE